MEILYQRIIQWDMTTANKTIIAFGASTTAPRGNLKVYSMHLAEKFPEYTVINSGVPGNSTQLAKERFQRDVLANHPDIVIILLGINDSMIDVWKDPPAGEPRVPIEIFEENMRYFINELEKINCIPILVSPQPLVWTEKLKGLYGKPPYKTDSLQGFNFMLVKYAGSISKIASEKKLPYINLTEAFCKYAKENNTDIDELYLDGMHPNDEGQKIIADALIKVIG